MEYTFWDFLQLVGSLGIFIYGMKVMSDGLQKAAGTRLRRTLATMTRNRFSGILTGFLTTAAIQSSSATTIMVVSFVNAGLLTLVGSLGVIMGANIGTTLTAWLVAILGFKVKITPIAIMLIGVAFPFLFSARSQFKNIAEFVVGFGILFIGLDFIKDAVPDLRANPEMLDFITSLTQIGYQNWVSTLIFIGIGSLLTVIIQSSSAATAITLTMLAFNWIPFPLACAMVLGENIGTTITANIAATIANVHAKRAARFHTIFNLIGVTWILLVFPFFIDFVQNSIDEIYTLFGSETFDTAAKKATKVDEIDGRALVGLAFFHSSFNILNVLMLAWFAPYFGRLVTRMVKPRGEMDEEFSLKYIGGGVVNTGELSIGEAKKELVNFADIVNKMTGNVYMLLFEENKKPDKLRAKILRREEITDRLEIEIAAFLAKISEKDLSSSGTQRIQSLLNMANDMERMGDVLVQLSNTHFKFQEQKISIPPHLDNRIKENFEFVHGLIQKLNKDIDLPESQIDMEEVHANEMKVNKGRDEMQKVIFAAIEKNSVSATTAILLFNVVNQIEKLGDHVVNVYQAIMGET